MCEELFKNIENKISYLEEIIRMELKSDLPSWSSIGELDRELRELQAAKKIIAIYGEDD